MEIERVLLEIIDTHPGWGVSLLGARDMPALVLFVGTPSHHAHAIIPTECREKLGAGYSGAVADLIRRAVAVVEASIAGGASHCCAHAVIKGTTREHPFPNCPKPSLN